MSVTETTSVAAGDELLGESNLVFDQELRVGGDPEAVWPWLLQLGKRRAGWYLPGSLERFLPPRRRALWRLEPAFGSLAVGDRVPDYGGPDEWLQVAIVDVARALVYRTERYGRPFTWALLLTPAGPGQSRLRLRFRGEIRSKGLAYRAITLGGGFLDQLAGRLLVAGLNERVAGRAG